MASEPRSAGEAGSAGDPYAIADARARSARRREGSLRAVLLPVLAVPVLVALFRSSFLAFLDGQPTQRAEPPTQLAEGMEQVLLRVGLVIVGWTALDVYAALVRSVDRPVLALLPVDGARVVRFELWRLVRDRAFVVPLFALLLSPVAASSFWFWFVSLPALLGIWLMSLSASAAVHLFAVQIAQDPRWAPVLDAIRGHNPRAQAAFLYAPGVILLGLGVLCGAIARAVPALAVGEWQALVWLVVPFAIGAVALLPLDGLARGNWYRASVVLADIEARYEAARTPEEARRVYLDGMVRFLPAPLRVFALRDLRHGWRARRTPLTGAWLLAVAAFAVGWTADPGGPVRSVLVAIASIQACGAVGVLLAAHEPEVLRTWYPPTGASRAARALVLAAWLQPLALVPAVAVSLRASVGAGVETVGFAELAIACAVALALSCERLGARALRAYASVAALAGGAVAVLAVGWL